MLAGCLLAYHTASDEGSQLITHQRPDFCHGVLAGDLAAKLGVEVLRAGAGGLAGNCEAILQDEDAEGQEAE